MLALAACGGGGGGGGSTPPPPAPSTYTIGGTVTGLAGTGLVLQNNAGGNLTVTGGTFTFATAVASGSAYAVTVLTQPSGPTQTCTVTSGGSGTATANVTNVAIACTTASFAVSGTVTGLSGSIVLQNNAAGNLTVSGATFSFPAQLSGSAYAITVLSHPTGPAQNCTVVNGTGTIGAAAVSNVAITCSTLAFTVGGTISGLTGTGLVIRDSSGQNATITGSNFTFPTALASGSTYAVTVLTQPTGPSQTCTVTSGTGTITTANVTNVVVNCLVGTFTVGGTVSGLATGVSVVLRNNAGNNLTVAANGSFTFTTPLASGSAYAVTVLTQPTGPSQTCTVTSGTGTVTTANITSVVVTCVVNTYTIGGTVSGLATGGNVVLQNNAGNNLTVSANGSFTFTTPVNSGAAYAVTRLTNPTVPAGTPAGQTCTVASGTGTVAGANVTSVTVTCVNNDVVAPTVSARAPANTAIGALLQATVTATFTEALKVSSVSVSTFTLTGPGGPVPGTVSTANSDQQAVFTPSAALAFDTTYTAALTTAVQDVAGNPIAAVTWSFNTGKKVAIGGAHACARFDDGRVKCWGRNNYGQLGIGNVTNHGDGTGLMGNGTTGGVGDGLVAVNLGRPVKALASGDTHTCAILDDGNVKCWGRNEHGELGLGFVSLDVGASSGDFATLIVPVNFGAGRTALEISAGDEISCARLDNDTLKCWGANSSGGLGQGNTTELGIAANDIANAPAISLGTNRKPVQIAVGAGWVCAILDDTSTKCFGDNFWGQLGDGDTNNRGDQSGEMGDLLPAINLGTGLYAVEVRASTAHLCARLQTGAVRCWGNNGWGQIGNNAGNGNPVDQALCEPGTSCIGDEPGETGLALANPIGAASAVSIVVGDRQSCARLTDGSVKCWGSNQFGQLGIGNNAGVLNNVGDGAGEMTPPLPTAVSLKPGKTMVELSGGGFFECTYNNDATLQCWGDNRFGQGGLDNGAIVDIGDGPGEMGANLIDLNLGT
ncbi:MAG: Ig-like domain-containing protein [Pseudomonadota bacterium]